MSARNYLEMMIGFVVAMAGLALMVKWSGQLIALIKGLLGLIVLLIGIIMAGIGYAEIKAERELKKIEEE